MSYSLIKESAALLPFKWPYYFKLTVTDWRCPKEIPPNTLIKTSLPKMERDNLLCMWYWKRPNSKAERYFGAWLLKPARWIKLLSITLHNYGCLNVQLIWSTLFICLSLNLESAGTADVRGRASCYVYLNSGVGRSYAPINTGDLTRSEQRVAPWRSFRG